MKRLIMLCCLLSTSASAAPNDLTPKPASPATMSAQEKTAASLPVDSGEDAAFATQGFIATLSDPVIRNKDGKPVWNFNLQDRYGKFDIMFGMASTPELDGAVMRT